MKTKEILDIINKIPINIDTMEGILEYNPLEVFVNRTREKEICHTIIIADLLNPKGKHRLGNIFLSPFIDHLKINGELCWNDVEVKKERSVQSCLSEMKKRSIDICIELTNHNGKYAIIIENKINNAIEQREQISDYKKGLEQEGYEVLKTVCLQGCYHKNIGADINITPKKLASIFTTLLPNTAYGIKSYLIVLKNMDKETDLLKTAKVIWDMDDDAIKKVRLIVSSFNVISKQAFIEIVNHLNKDKTFNFQAEKSYGNTGDVYKIDSDKCLQLWHEESYHQGHNQGFWIEIWFHDFNRFEIWVKKDKDVELDRLDYYVKSREYPKYYVDKNIDSSMNDGIEAKKFDYPNKEKFNEMINYVSYLYRKLYQLNE